MASYYETSEFRNGLKVEIDGVPFEMIYFQFVKPGKGTAFTRTKLKNMLTGSVIERTYRTGERLDAADIETHPMQYMYNDGEYHHFINTEDSEQVGILSTAIAHEAQFLTDDLQVDVLFYKKRPMSISLPNHIESEIVYCEPGVKGNTATGATKEAELACGVKIQVPLFLEVGDMLRVDTRTGEYLTRVLTAKENEKAKAQAKKDNK